MIRALIVDDEPLARARVRRLLAAEPDVEVISECADGASALAMLAVTAIDLLVLDIEMPAPDGFDVASALDGSLPAVIFATAHEQHARRAFDADAVDYLLKPLDPDRMVESMARVRRRIELDRGARRIPVRTGNRIRFVATQAIDWIEAQGNYAALHAGDRVELIRETMTSLEQRLDPDRFVRIHRRLIVRIDRIQELAPQPTGEYTVRLRDGVRLLSGRTYRTRVAALTRGTWPGPLEPASRAAGRSAGFPEAAEATFRPPQPAAGHRRARR
jgi:two-component system LytT family response regulator